MPDWSGRWPHIHAMWADLVGLSGLQQKKKRTWKQEEAVLGMDGSREKRGWMDLGRTGGGTGRLGVDMSKVVVVSYIKLSKYKYILYKRKRKKSLIEFGLVKFHGILF